MTKIRKIPLQETDSAKVSVADSLREILRAIEEGEIEPQSSIVLMVGHELEGTGFTTHWERAGVDFSNHSKTIFWLEFFKDRLLGDMIGWCREKP